MSKFSKSLINNIRLSVACSINFGHKVDRQHIRDIADVLSGQELDIIELDILTDMAIADLKIEVAP